MDVISAIDKRIGEVRTESLDLSVGELISLHQNKELIIQPDFQRLFRWEYEQRSRLVESLLLELPIPSVFLIEKETGVLELIDGLQRISSLIQFVNPVDLSLEPLTLQGCDLVPELNGITYELLPLTLRLKLKRTGIRTVIVKRQSSQSLRYEMFKRLNTGGSDLSDQDIRNVNARMLSDAGAAFYQFLTNCAAHASFSRTIELLPETAVDARADEELVLRYFATKNYRDKFKGSIKEWLDKYMEDVILKHVQFNFDAEKQTFERLFDCLAKLFGPHAFVKYRSGAPVGGVAPAYFEAVTAGGLAEIESLESMSPETATAKLASTVEGAAFRQVTGPGANSVPKLTKRISLVQEAFSALTADKV